MKRAAFLKRMAFAALACGFLEVRSPAVETVAIPFSEPWTRLEVSIDGGEWQTIEGPAPLVVPVRPGSYTNVRSVMGWGKDYDGYWAELHDWKISSKSVLPYRIDA